MMFQFHKGAIRTKESNQPHGHHPTFQFHKGAIRTDLISIIFFLHSSFNSIKVQLEPVTTRIVTSSFTMGFGDLFVKDLSLTNVDI